VPIYSKVAGFLEDVKVDIGDKFKKGELLAKIWAPETAEDFRVAASQIVESEANLMQAKSAVPVAEANIQTWEAKVKEASTGLKRAEANYARWHRECEIDSDMVKKGILDQQTLDEAKNQLKAVEAVAVEAKAKLDVANLSKIGSVLMRDKAKAEVEACEALLDARKQRYQFLRDLLDYTKITAPCGGIVTRRIVRTGHFVQPSIVGNAGKAPAGTSYLTVPSTGPHADKALFWRGYVNFIRGNFQQSDRFFSELVEYHRESPLRSQALAFAIQAKNMGTSSTAPSPVTMKPPPEALLVITRTDRMRVVLTVSERDAFFIKEGADAIVRLPALKDREIACKIDRTSWMLDGKTHQLRVEIFLDNPKDELQPGMSANVSILEQVSDTMTLPADAILTDGTVKYCFLVENGKATRRNVKVGVANKGRIEVLAKQMPPAKPGEEGAWVKFTGTERALIFDLRSIEESKGMSKEKP